MKDEVKTRRMKDEGKTVRMKKRQVAFTSSFRTSFILP
jgi:hypothetical protein